MSLEEKIELRSPEIEICELTLSHLHSLSEHCSAYIAGQTCQAYFPL